MPVHRLSDMTWKEVRDTDRVHPSPQRVSDRCLSLRTVRGSVVLAESPSLVRLDVAAEIEPNPASLSDAILDWRSTFGEAGGHRAYFGGPARATAEEDRETVRVLGELLAEAVFAGEGAEV